MVLRGLWLAREFSPAAKRLVLESAGGFTGKSRVSTWRCSCQERRNCHAIRLSPVSMQLCSTVASRKEHVSSPLARRNGENTELYFLIPYTRYNNCWSRVSEPKSSNFHPTRHIMT